MNQWLRLKHFENEQQLCHIVDIQISKLKYSKVKANASRRWPAERIYSHVLILLHLREMRFELLRLYPRKCGERVTTGITYC